MDALHRISQILIERETIDKDQFERLLAGEDEDSVFAEPPKPDDPDPKPQRDTTPPKPGPVPLPGGATV